MLFFDCFNKTLIVLFLLSGCISVSSFANAIGTPIGIVTANFSLAFLIFTETVKKTVKNDKKEKGNYNKVVMLATTKLKSIKSKISEALINSEISREDLITFAHEEKNIENQKEALE